MSVPPSDPAADATRQEAQTWVLFLLLSSIWGSSFLFIKIGLEEGVPPYTVVSLRAILGGLFLAGVMWLRSGRLPRTRTAWWRMSVVAITNIAIPFTLITWGELHIASGMAGILNALVPLFAVVLSAFVLRDDPATPNRVAGLLIGFGGVVLLALPSLSAAGGSPEGELGLLGMLAVAGASLSYAVGAVYARHRLTGRPIMTNADGTARPPTALEISFGQVLVAGILITTLAVAFERPADGVYAVPTSAEAWFALLWLGVLGTGLAHILFFRIIGAWGATRATLVTYVMPPIAIVLGFVVLGERLRPIELVGTGLIIGGIVLVNLQVGRRRSAAGARP